MSYPHLPKWSEMTKNSKQLNNYDNSFLYFNMIGWSKHNWEVVMYLIAGNDVFESFYKSQKAGFLEAMLICFNCALLTAYLYLLNPIATLSQSWYLS